jgi:hypothetical protein
VCLPIPHLGGSTSGAEAAPVVPASAPVYVPVSVSPEVLDCSALNLVVIARRMLIFLNLSFTLSRADVSSRYGAAATG